MKKIIWGVATLLLLSGNIHATSIGYSQEKIERTNIFRLGSGTTQGQAIRLSKAKLQALKGKTIDFAEFVVGSRQTTNNELNVFITTSLDATPIEKGTVKISRAFEKCKWTLDTPYTITGNEEELYIGYTAEIKESYKLLLSDYSYDIPDCNYGYQDGAWVNTYGMNKGSAYITFNVDGDVDYTDVILGKSNFEGYFKVGNKYDFSVRLVNEGTTTINSFDADVTIGDKTSTYHYDKDSNNKDLSIAPKAKYSFTLPGLDANKEGSQHFSLTVKNINGTAIDIDPSDNSMEKSIYFYPSNMERSILVEGFTGQTCPQCPNGHTNINQAIKNSDESIVEVSHHSGYYPDMFTMEEDMAYLFYYNGGTYAPAMTANRNAYSSIGTAPVVNALENSYISAVISHAAESKPYVSLKLASDLNEQTRELKVKLSIYPHEQLPSDKVLFNVFLVQDSLIGYQSNGGSNYVHNRVFRGTVTGNSWGVFAEGLTPGKVTSWEKTITIPEYIHSSYWTEDMLDNGYYGSYKEEQTNIKVDFKNMYLVAFVADYDASDNAKNTIYNCCETKFGETYIQKAFDNTTAIKAVTEKPNANITVHNGEVIVNGDYEKLSVYNLAGRQMDANSKLAQGVYIIKVVANGKQTTQKVLVR